jgi:hypothetical protein
MHLAIEIAAIDTKSAGADWKACQPAPAGFVLVAAISIAGDY